jgi:ferredoxin-NADP reductase/Na+-translocating ferredoxin:NAD+ oxidoreductase RnfD subunit
MKNIDKYLDRITMYRLLLYYLGAILALALILGAVGILHYSPTAITMSALFTVVVCWITNSVFSRVYHTPSNPESSLITALILTLIITPPPSAQGYLFLAAAGGLAIASKYILSFRYKHIFNPAAIAIVLTAIGPRESASWWVGTASLLPVVIFGGYLMVRKMRRVQTTLLFLAVALLTIVIFASINGKNSISTVSATLGHSPLFFLAFVMLTEPLTSPTTRKWQLWYVVIVGIVFSPDIHLGTIYSTPELALVLGNLFAFTVTPKVRSLVRLTGKQKWGSSTYDFIFTPSNPFTYRPGQYIELTLPHGSTDNRGSRRYFTLASSPTEKLLRVGARFYEPGSSFKTSLLSSTDTTQIAMGQLGGDFILPDDPTKKLVFIAGGIGITPFRSMLQYLIDTNDSRSVSLFYSERSSNELVYTDVITAAQKKIGARIFYMLSNQNGDVPSGMYRGKITSNLLSERLGDRLSDSWYYISGPQPMVESMRQQLYELGVSRSQVKTDYFSGYA